MAYLAAGAEAAATRPSDSPELEARLSALIATARVAWPTLVLSEDEFLRYLAERLPEGASPAAALEQLHASDLYLTCACALGKPRALECFERHCLVELPAALMRFASQPEFHDEVRQTLRERLFVVPVGGRARIEDYGGRGALTGWVRVVAARLAVDRLRLQGKQPLTLEEDALSSLAIGSDVELRLLAERYRGEVKEAFREAFAALSTADRNLLRLHYLDSLTIDDIAAMKRVHRSTAARRIARACELVAEKTHQILIERLGIAASQVQSVMRLVRSQLDLSLHRWLGKGPARS